MEIVGSRRQIDVVLQATASSLDQIVVIGYGTTTKKDLTGSISSIKSSELEKVASNSFTSAIQGKVPGVFISHTSGGPGGATSVRIRGIGSTGNNQPLYVVDGLPVGGGNMSIPGSTDKIDALSIINPNDIESIEILKDASAAAIYGARAANGVVLITTKHGKEGRTKINFSAYTGFQQLWKKPELLNAEEFATLANELYKNSGMTPNPEWANPASLGKGTDWIDQIFRTAPVQNYYLSASGGTQKLNARASLGYFNQKGTMIETWYKRYTGRLSVNLEANDKLSFGSNFAFALTEGKGQRNQLMNRGILNLALEYYPTLGPKDVIDGSSAYYTTQADNPVLRAKSIDNKLVNLRIYGTVFGEYEIISGLSWKTSIGIDANNNRRSAWEPKVDRGYYHHLQATLSNMFTQGLSWQIQNTLSYSNSFNKHRIDIVIGQTAQKENSHYISATGISFPNEQLRVINGSEKDLREAGGSISYYALASYLGRIKYSYQDKYLLSASLRRDGSSNFGPKNKWGNFPALAVGWNIAGEEFMKSLNFINRFKLRASWGQTGNDAIGSFGYLSTIRSGTNTDNYVLGAPQETVTGATMSRPGNPNLKWEASEQIDVGIDGAFFNQKLHITADYYVKNRKGLLIQLPVSLEAGFQNAPKVNGGEVRNSGFELSVSYNGNIEDFHFSASGNISTLNNKVLSLGTGQPITGPTLYTGKSFSYTEVGQPIGYYRGYIVKGIYQTKEEVNKQLQPNAVAGDFKYKDINGDNQLTDEDKVKIGSPWPDIMYGMNINASYRNFDFSILLQGVAGNQIFHSNKISIYPIRYYGGSGVVNAVKEALNRWTPGSDRNEIPGLKYTDANGNYKKISTFFVEDGSYMRVRNVMLGYTIPTTIISKTNVFENLRVYLSAKNLFTITKYSGFDPEIGSTNPLNAGNDNGVYPQPRTVIFGVNISF